MGVSIMSVEDVKMIDQGVFAKSEYQASFRDINEQVTEGRFEPALFDANIQTDRELIELYFAKQTQDFETVTESPPVPKVLMKQMMIQTDPEIEEFNDELEPQLYHIPC